MIHESSFVLCVREGESEWKSGGISLMRMRGLNRPSFRTVGMMPLLFNRYRLLNRIRLTEKLVEFCLRYKVILDRECLITSQILVIYEKF